MDSAAITDGMSVLQKDWIPKQLERVYDDIFSQIKSAPAVKFANMFTSLEAKYISNFYVALEKEVRLCAEACMSSAGVPKDEIPFIWIRVRNSTPIPQAKLCNEGHYTPSGTDARHEPVKKAEPEQNAQAPKVGQWILISGAVIEILSWIYIPASNFWVPIVRGIGVVVMGAGVYRIYHENKQPARIQLTAAAEQSLREQSAKEVRKICEMQYELNRSIFCQWVNTITEKTLGECAAF